MEKTISIVAARRELGRLAEEVRRTGRPVILTNRGRAVARIAPEPRRIPGARKRRNVLEPLRGTIRMSGDFDDLKRAIRTLRSEFARNLERRAEQVTLAKKTGG